MLGQDMEAKGRDQTQVFWTHHANNPAQLSEVLKLGFLK